jgi:enoyl-CoA hydratase/carnithine racemase
LTTIKSLIIHAALDEADADSEARAIILTGAGRAFSAGYDMAPSPERPQSTLDPAGQPVGDYLM